MIFSDLHEHHVTTCKQTPKLQNKTPSLKNKAKAQKLREYWRLSNEPQVIKEIMEIKQDLESSENDSTTDYNLYDTDKSIYRKKFIVIRTYILKKKKIREELGIWVKRLSARPQAFKMNFGQ